MQVGCALGIYLCIQKGPRAAYFDIFFAYRNIPVQPPDCLPFKRKHTKSVMS